MDWTEKTEALKYIDILKVNEHEMEVLTGHKEVKQAAFQLAEWGVKEVLITLGSLGSVIFAEGCFYRIPAYPPKKYSGCHRMWRYLCHRISVYEEQRSFL